MNSSGTIHEDLLRNHCRLCGSEKVIPVKGLPVQKGKFAKDVKKLFDIDFLLDTNIHPPFLCDCCRLKISKWRKKTNQKIKSSVNIELFQYEEHGEHCKICANFIHVDQKENESVNDYITKFCTEFGFSVHENDNEYLLFKVAVSTQKFSHRIYIDKKTREWHLFVYDINVTQNVIFNTISRQMDSENIKLLLETIAKFNICDGNIGYEDLCQIRRSTNRSAIFLAQDGLQVNGYEEAGFSHINTIRHSKCELLIEHHGRCGTCDQYRVDLNTMRRRIEKKPLSSISVNHTRNDYLSPDQTVKKLKIMKESNRHLKRKVSNLESRLYEHLSGGESEVLSEKMENSLTDILTGNEDKLNSLAEGSPQRLLWDQQLLYLKKADKRSMRWHPTIIKWCIAIHCKSSKVYDLLRSSGFLHLPHQNTLRDYTNFTEAKNGVNLDVVKRIKVDIEFEKLKDYQKNVVLLFDEIKIKDGLVYSTETGELVGFTELSDINNEIESLINHCKGDHDKPFFPPLATHVIAFMVRGIFLNFHTVFAHFPCTSFNSHQLFWSVWPLIELLEYAGFYVRAMVCDGATPNRKFYRGHNLAQDQDGFTYFADSSTAINRRIYFICDPPHLMKTTRNNWENSNWHNKTRHLEFDHQQITWSQLVNLAEGDLLDNNGQAGGLRILSKITNEHLRLTPSLRMKVKLATQVLSVSVARAFELVDRLNPTTRSTRKFVTYMDTFFDCLNVSRCNLDKQKKKPTLATYTDQSDWRLEWLEEDFLLFLRQWENQSMARLDLSKDKRRRLCLSKETLEGLRITVKSFTKLTRELLSTPGVEYVLSGKFSQDPLEIYFSKQRGCGGNNENPTVLEFNRNARKIFIAGTSGIRGAARGNLAIGLDFAFSMDWRTICLDSLNAVSFVNLLSAKNKQ